MATLITRFRDRRGPSPTGENVIVKNEMWSCCPYCHLEHERKVELNVSPIIGGGLKCPSCGRRWDSPAAFNAATKELIERVAKDAPWLLDRPTKEEVAQEEAWQKEMDESIRKHKASLPKSWSPYFNPDDAPVVRGVDGFKDDPLRKDANDDSGVASDDATAGGNGSSGV